MNLQSRNARWLAVARNSRGLTRLAIQAANNHKQAGREIGDQAKRVLVIGATEPIHLTLESDPLVPESWLSNRLHGLAEAISKIDYGDGFVQSLETVLTEIDRLIPSLEEQTSDDDASIESIVDELERALLISLVVSLTAHNVILEKVEDWNNQHKRFKEGRRETDYGHWFSVSTLTYSDQSGPGRIHMQHLLSALDAGVTMWVAGGGRSSVDHYPELFSVTYAAWFAYMYAIWEEQFRRRIAEYFDARTEQRIRRSDVVVDFFGDIRRIRNDFVHNKGICDESAHLSVLDWDFTAGQPLQIMPEKMLSLIALFPRQELETAPLPREPGARKVVPGSIDPHLLEDA